MLKYKSLLSFFMKLLFKAVLLLVLIFIPGVLAANVDLDKLDVVKFSVSQGDEKTLQFNDVEYKIMVDSVSENDAKLTLLPVNYETVIGKEQKADIDINDDNDIDFSLTFVSSTGKSVSLEAKRIGTKKVKAEGEAEGEEKQGLPDLANLSNILKQNLKFIAGVLAVLIFIILIVAFSRRKGNPEKFYRRAESLHMEAQEFHEDGDEETAAELYTKAEEYREKARSLEKGEM